MAQELFEEYATQITLARELAEHGGCSSSHSVFEIHRVAEVYY